MYLNNRRRLILRGAIFPLLLCFGTMTNNVYGQDYNIILGRPTDTSITLSILSETKLEYYINYGTLPGIYPKVSPTFKNSAGVTDEIDLNELKKDTRYYYLLNYRLLGESTFKTSPEYTFHTQRSEGTPFTFTIEADEHLYDKKGIRSMYQVTLNNQALDKPDFMLSLGDIFGDDHNPFEITSDELDELHKDYRPYLGSICHSIPFYVCLGNHEGENDYYFNKIPENNLCVWGTQWRKFYYPNPYPNGFYSGNKDNEPYGIGNPENYFAWTWGDAHFIVLDVYRDQCDTSEKPQKWDWSLGKPQYDWLRTTLETSKSKYKFVFAHHVRGQGRGAATNAPLYEWGGREKLDGPSTFDKNRPGWGKPIHQLFIDNGVNVFFQGHDHLFAHEVLDGVTYQEVPMPSDSTYQIGMLANADAYLSDTVDGTGHIRVAVNPDCIKIDYIKAFLPKDTLSGKNKNRSLGFSYTLGKCATTGTTDPIDAQDVKLYPNPANDKLTLQVLSGSDAVNTKLVNLCGQLVLQSTEHEISVSALPSGIYIATIEVDTQRYLQKIIIQH